MSADTLGPAVAADPFADIPIDRRPEVHVAEVNGTHTLCGLPVTHRYPFGTVAGPRCEVCRVIRAERRRHR